MAELERALQDQQQQPRNFSIGECQKPAAPAAAGCPTPCSVLQFLPPSPPRANPVRDALRSTSATGSGSAGIVGILPNWNDGAVGKPSNPGACSMAAYYLLAPQRILYMA